MFDDFDCGFYFFLFYWVVFDIELFWWCEWVLMFVFVVDVVEIDMVYEIKVDLFGMEEKDVEVKLVNGGLMIKGEK